MYNMYEDIGFPCSTDRQSGRMMESFRGFLMMIEFKFTRMRELFDRSDMTEDEKIEDCRKFMEEINNWHSKLNKDIHESH